VKCGTRSASAPRQPGALERFLDDPMAAAVSDQGVRGFHEALSRQASDGMVGAHEASVGIAEQHAAAHRRPEPWQEAHRKVERARGKCIRDVLDVDRHRFEPHPGCHALHALHQRREKLDLADIGHIEAEGARRACRIEPGPMCQRGLQQRERLAHRLGELTREGRRIHAPRRAHEEGIAECAAQPGERVRDRRLREAQSRGRRGHPMLVQHRVEYAQEIQVEVLNIHIHDSYHAVH
jgi:hypothetical protein